MFLCRFSRGDRPYDNVAAYYAENCYLVSGMNIDSSDTMQIHSLVKN